MYDPTTAKFISEDPLGFEAEGTNLYGYVLNNPVNYTDPYGEDLYSVLNTVDRGAAGFADAVTFGGSTKFREIVYGDIARRNHTGGVFVAGQLTGAVASFALGYGAEANLVKISPWLLKGIRAYDALGTTIDGYNGLKNILSGCGDWTDWLGLAPALGGASYWKQFETPKGISFNHGLKDHLVDGVRTEIKDGKANKVVDIVRRRNKGLKGGHNLDNFNTIASNNNFNIVSKTESSDIQGLYEIEYQLPKLSDKPKPGTDELYPIGGFKQTVNPPKTVYDPQRFSDDLILDLGQKAANKGFNDAIQQGKRSYTEVVGGMKFEVHLDSKTKSFVDNFYPTF